MLDNNITLPKKETTDYTPLPEDVYTVELLDVTSKVGETYDSKKNRAKDSSLEPEMETTLTFQFVLLDGEDNGKSLRGRSLWQNFVPSYLYISNKHGKNTLYNIVEAMQGQTVSPQQEAEGITGAYINSLIGKQCRIATTNKTVGDKTFTNIEKFLVAKGVTDGLTAQEKIDATPKPKDEAAEATAAAQYEGEEVTN